MNQFFEEINEDVRRDRVIQFLKKYANLIIGVMVILTLTIGGYYGWKSYQRRGHIKDAKMYMQALSLHEDNQTEDALGLLQDLQTQSKTVYKHLATLVYARLTAEQASDSESQKALQSLANDTRAHAQFRHLAAFLSSIGKLSTDNAHAFPEKLTKETIVTNPWSTLILEVIAFSKMITGNYDQARDDFESLKKNPRTNEGIRTRSEAMLSLINYSPKK